MAPRLLFALLLPAAATVAAWRLSPEPPARSGPTPSPAAPHPPPHAGPPALALEHLDAGVLQPGQRVEREVAWTNPGGPWRVIGARSGCGCAAWIDPPTLLAARSSGALRVGLTAPDVAGPIDLRLRLVGDVPAPHDVLTLRVSAFVGAALVLRPAALDLGARRTGERHTVRVEVHLPPGAGGPVEPRLSAWPGDVEVVAAARHDQRGPDLLLHTTFEGAPGTLEGLLTVRAPGAAAGCLPLRARTVPPDRYASLPSSR